MCVRKKEVLYPLVGKKNPSDRAMDKLKSKSATGHVEGKEIEKIQVMKERGKMQFAQAAKIALHQ